VRSTIEEAAAYGAALQARWAVACDRSGQPTSLPEIAAAWAPAMQEATSQESDPESTRRYDEVYDLFRRLTDRLKPIFAMAPRA
jgi:sugar (pentulose or hexulose) kinase